MRGNYKTEPRNIYDELAESILLMSDFEVEEGAFF